MSTPRLRARGVPRDVHADYAPDSPVRRIHGDRADTVRGRRASGFMPGTGTRTATAAATPGVRHVITPTTTDRHRHASHEGHRDEHLPARPLPAYQPACEQIAMAAGRPQPTPEVGSWPVSGSGRGQPHVPFSTPRLADCLWSEAAPRPRQVRPRPPTTRHARGPRPEHAEMADMGATGDTCT
jgi:hypothetical protein